MDIVRGARYICTIFFKCGGLSCRDRAVEKDKEEEGEPGIWGAIANVMGINNWSLSFLSPSSQEEPLVGSEGPDSPPQAASGAFFRAAEFSGEAPRKGSGCETLREDARNQDQRREMQKCCRVSA